MHINFSGLSELRDLSVYATPLFELNGFGSLENLIELDMRDTLVTDFSVLKQLPKLRNVKVCTEDKSDIEKTLPEKKFRVEYVVCGEYKKVFRKSEDGSDIDWVQI